MATTAERETSFCNKAQTDVLTRALLRQKQEWLFCDVLIKVGELEISAHSNVLAAVSPYFAAFFSQEVPRNFSQKSPQIIEIRIDGCHESNSIYEAAVDAIIDYIYTGEIRVGGSSVAQISEIAKTMQLDDVVLFCEDFINEKVTISQVLKLGKVVSDASVGATSEGPTPAEEVVVRGNEMKPIHLLLSNLPVAHPSSCGNTTRARSVKKNSIATQVRPSLLGIQSSPAEMKDQSTSTDKRIFWNFVRYKEPSGIKMKAGVAICDDENMETTPAESQQAATLIAVGVVDCDRTVEKNSQNSLDALSGVKCDNAGLVDSTHTNAYSNQEIQNTSPISSQGDKDHKESAVRHSSRVRRKPLKLLEAGETYVEPSLGIESANKDIHEMNPSPDKTCHELVHNDRLQDQEIQLAGNEIAEGNEITAGTIELILASTPVEVEHALDSICPGNPQTAAKFSRSKMKKRPASLLGETTSDWKKFRCDSCAFGTNNVRSMSAHNKLHKISDNICYYCELKFEGKKSLELHMLEHTNQTMPFFCRFCQQHFQSRTQLMLHLPKHSDEKPYICEVCSVGFKWKNALKNHMITHDNKKEHLCDICGYATAHRCQLKAHRLVHTGETIRCPQEGCNYHATKAQNLKYHMLTHTQEKAHQCEVCGTSFSLVKNLKRHMLLHTSQKTHKCDLCDFASTRYDKLKEHLHKQHSIGTAPERRLRITDMVYQNRIIDNTGSHGQGSADSKPSASTSYEQLTDVGDMKSDLEVFYSGDYQMLELPDGVQVDDVKDLRFLSNQTTIILTNADNIGSLAVQSHLANVTVAAVSSEGQEEIYNGGEPVSGCVDGNYIEDDDNQSNDYVC